MSQTFTRIHEPTAVDAATQPTSHIGRSNIRQRQRQRRPSPPAHFADLFSALSGALPHVLACRTCRATPPPSPTHACDARPQSSTVQLFASLCPAWRASSSPRSPWNTLADPPASRPRPFKHREEMVCPYRRVSPLTRAPSPRRQPANLVQHNSGAFRDIAAAHNAPSPSRNRLPCRPPTRPARLRPTTVTACASLPPIRPSTPS